MPNWCTNSVYIGHDDPSALDRVEQAYQQSRLCEEFIPIPEELRNPETGSYGGPDAEAKDELREQLKAKYGYPGWWEFCVNEWGTKWDVGGDDSNCIRSNEHNLVLGFDSAWAPPLGVLQELVNQGYRVKAYYWEPGMCYAGVWDNGEDDYYEYSSIDVDDLEEMLPEDLDHEFNIVQSISEWQDSG